MAQSDISRSINILKIKTRWRQYGGEEGEPFHDELFINKESQPKKYQKFEKIKK